MKKVRKAIIPAAGLGTRVLPASKAVPKEMLNIVDKPAIQYIVEEAFESGIEEVLIITNRGKGAIEDHFDHAFELESKLEGQPGKEKILDSVKIAQNSVIFIFCVKGNGRTRSRCALRQNICRRRAVCRALRRRCYNIRQSVTKQLIDAYEKYGKGAVGVKEVSDEAITKYCSLKISPLEGNCYNCTDMIEKPKKEEIMSNFSILGRVVLPSEIFEILENTPLGAGNELQLTDAMKTLARDKGVTAVDFIGKRYDMGNKFGILQANIEVGLNHPEIKDDLREYIKQISKEL